MKRLIAEPVVIKINDKARVVMYNEIGEKHHNPHVLLKSNGKQCRILIPFDLNESCTIFKEDEKIANQMNTEIVEKALITCNAYHEELLESFKTGNIHLVCTLNFYP